MCFFNHHSFIKFQINTFQLKVSNKEFLQHHSERRRKANKANQRTRGKGCRSCKQMLSTYTRVQQKLCFTASFFARHGDRHRRAFCILCHTCSYSNVIIKTFYCSWVIIFNLPAKGKRRGRAAIQNFNLLSGVFFSFPTRLDPNGKLSLLLFRTF